MYYIWEQYSDNSTKFFSCGIGEEHIEQVRKVNFILGKKSQVELPNPIHYHAANMLLPKDFPMTAGGISHFLVSKKIADILQKLNMPDIDYYPSVIIRPNDEIIENFYTLNIMNNLACVNFKKSKYIMDEFGPAKMYGFKKLVLDHSKIPKDIKLFHLEEKALIVAHEDIVKACEDEGVTGIDFVPVEKYRDLGI